MFRVDYYKQGKKISRWFLSLESATEFISNLSMEYDIDAVYEI